MTRLETAFDEGIRSYRARRSRRYPPRGGGAEAFYDGVARGRPVTVGVTTAAY